MTSVILWGPPGTGKTTIAHLVARAADRRFVALSALTAGVKDVRAVIDEARRLRIPLVSGARSLNVVTAATLALGEALRQNNAYPVSPGTPP